MSDETPEPAGGATPPDLTKPDAAAPRPTSPGVAAARRARQLGGQRRPLPRPAADTETPTPPTRAAGSRPRPKPAPAPAKPATNVGRRPRPRPTPAGRAATTTAAVEPETARPGASRTLVVASLALTVVLLAVGVLFLVRTLTASAPVSQRETDRALAAAKTDVALFTSYGYQTIDADSAKAAAVLTGQFKQDYLTSIAQVIKPKLPTTKTVNTGQVDTAGLVSVSPDGRQAVVVVYGQNSVTNVAQTTPRIDAFQLLVTMQQVKGEWLVSQLKQLGNNA